MGDATNLATRLEDMTKEGDFPILMSDETYQTLAKVPDVGARPLNDVMFLYGRCGKTSSALLTIK